MTDSAFLWFGRIRARLLVVSTSFVLLLPSLATAQAMTEEEQTKAIRELQTSVARLEKEATLSPQIVAISNDLKEVRNSLTSLQQTRSAPDKAWTALMWVGIVFGVAWAVVSLRREQTRALEIETNGRNADVSAQTTANEAELEKRLNSVVGMLKAVKVRRNEAR